MKRSNSGRLLGLLIICAFTFGGTLFGKPLAMWHWRNPLPQGNTLLDVKYLNGTFIAVGAAGTILTSLNGIDWTRQNSGTYEDLHGVAFGNGIYVVSGANGCLLTSTNALSWARRFTGSTNLLAGVTFGAGVFVAAENSGGFAYDCGLLVSTNGVNWSLGRPASYAVFNGITYGGGLFVAVGGTDGGHVVTSTNGVDWIQASYYDLQLNGAGYGKGVFVAVGANWYGEPGTIATSTNGESWTSRESGTPNALNGVCVGLDSFVAAGDSGTVLSSPDGVTWSGLSSGTGNDLKAVAYGNGVFVAVGAEGTILTSSDGEIWINRVADNDLVLNGVAYGNHRLVAVGNGGRVLTSADGVSWTAGVSGTTNNLDDIAFGGGMFATVGSKGIRTSTNGVDWTQQSGLPATAVTYGNGMFVAVNNIINSGAGVFVSTNGMDWSVAAPTIAMFDVAYGNGVFVGVYSFGPVLRSTNAVDWVQIDYAPAGSRAYLNSIAFGNGHFVAAGSGYGGIITSADGLTWSPAMYPSRWDYLNCVAYGNGLFVVGGANYHTSQSVLTSCDGTNWALIPWGAKAVVNDIVYAAGTFVAVGAGGAILQSEELRSPWLTGKRTPSGEFEVDATGELGRPYRLQVSEDLRSWSDVSAYTNDQFEMRLVDPSATNRTRGYYRAVSP